MCQLYPCDAGLQRSPGSPEMQPEIFQLRSAAMWLWLCNFFSLLTALPASVSIDAPDLYSTELYPHQLV